jgi:FKBP-type peptidyl-prolyl cis-trans isomerase
MFLSLNRFSTLSLPFRIAALALTACSSGLAQAPPPAAAPVAQESDEEAEKPAATAEPEPEAAKAPFEPIEPISSLVSPAPPDPNAPKDLTAPPADAERQPSGLVTKVLKAGTGKDHPSVEDTVTVKHVGWMASGSKFETSGDRGDALEYVVGSAPPGWAEGVRLMVVGEKRRLWIPGRLAYGDSPRQFGLPYGPLVYDVELVAIKRPPAPPEVPSDLKEPPAEAKRTASGIAYLVLEKGAGTTHPRPNSTVEVHYSGWDMEGRMFDSSVARGQSAVFSLGSVIRGWREGLPLMVVGDKMRFWIPAKLAYGEKPQGGSPAGPLVFDVELIAIKDRR